MMKNSHRGRFALLVSAGLIVCAMASCSLGGQVWQANEQAIDLGRAQKIDSLLGDAGFKRVAANSPNAATLQSLTPLMLNKLTNKDRIRYYLRDPYSCQCTLTGDGAAYERYKALKLERAQANQEAANFELNEEDFGEEGPAREEDMFNPVFEQ